MADWRTVYHTTTPGNGENIVKNGWNVSRGGTNIYGRGIYFWEKKEDAHSYGTSRFGKNKYEIVSESIPFRKNNIVVYDHGKAFGTIDSLAQGLLRRGKEIVEIPNPMIEVSTHAKARGKAYLWLVDISKEYVKVS